VSVMGYGLWVMGCDLGEECVINGKEGAEHLPHNPKLITHNYSVNLVNPHDKPLKSTS
jgi:hypothetical protein